MDALYNALQRASLDNGYHRVDRSPTSEPEIIFYESELFNQGLQDIFTKCGRNGDVAIIDWDLMEDPGQVRDFIKGLQIELYDTEFEPDYFLGRIRAEVAEAHNGQRKVIRMQKLERLGSGAELQDITPRESALPKNTYVIVQPGCVEEIIESDPCELIDHPHWHFKPDPEM